MIGDPNTYSRYPVPMYRGSTAGTRSKSRSAPTMLAQPGTSAADGTGYGDLFITPGAHAWHPTGTAPYPNDTYQPGEWEYVATIPQDPGSTTGNGALYLTSGGTVVTSNVDGHFQTYPNDPTSGYYFRADQAVDFTPGSKQGAVGGPAKLGPLAPTPSPSTLSTMACWGMISHSLGR